ncbi:hypothetical protein A7U60_g2285 [Sanghuangporus baumii]|uniref:Uncharacterized protein n=1 Tax=Sanghuangporus baumii TaxID=108892 RepID=A0A9Q5I2I6_SANBA|nr:hypothetical protein A7U60_g2285 [Sanghuangporus baumii]
MATFSIVMPSAPAIATASPERLPNSSRRHSTGPEEADEEAPSLEYKAAALTYRCSLYAEFGALAQSATIFPVALGPEANLQGEIIGSGGEVGTTFVLSGETLGISFTRQFLLRTYIGTTIFPVALGPEANLQGEIIGSGGEVGTTFVLSGETLGISFTRQFLLRTYIGTSRSLIKPPFHLRLHLKFRILIVTLAQDASRVVERVAIPSRSYDLSVGCVVSAGSAICQNVVVSAGVTSAPPLTTLPYSPFAVPVSTSGVLPSSTSSVSGSASATVTTVLTSVPGSTLVTNAPSTSSASTPVVASSAITSQVTISASSATVSTSASTATLASPSASQSDTSHGSKIATFSVGVALIVPMTVTMWIVT